MTAALFYLGWLGTAHGAEPAKPDHNILVLGDSLSAEYGIKRDSGWVRIVDQKLQDAEINYTMRNASISGDTSSGGLSRLPAALKRHQPDIVIIELGSNDALRGLPLEMTHDNIARMIELSKQTNARVLLVGMQIPPNYGRAYAQQFQSMFVKLADKHQTDFVPFLLDGVALDKSMFQDDGLHPNEAAQPALADNIWAALRPMVLSQQQ